MKLTRGVSFCLFVVLVLLALFTTAAAQGTVALGSDYFQTVPGNDSSSGTYFNFGSGIGVVDFQAVPIGPYATDTIVQRQADATLNGPAIPIQLAALSMASEAPVLVGGNLYNVSVTLNNAFASTGTIMIMGNTTTGGTFSSLLNVFFDAKFNPVGAGNPFDIKSETTLTSSGTQWSPKPTTSFLEYGPLGDQQANCHFGNMGGCLPPGGSEVDFFVDVNSLLKSCTQDMSGCHEITPVPEPSALLLVVPAVIGMFWKLGMKAGSRVLS